MSKTIYHLKTRKSKRARALLRLEYRKGDLFSATIMHPLLPKHWKVIFSRLDKILKEENVEKLAFTEHLYIQRREQTKGKAKSRAIALFRKCYEEVFDLGYVVSNKDKQVGSLHLFTEGNIKRYLESKKREWRTKTISDFVSAEAQNTINQEQSKPTNPYNFPAEPNESFYNKLKDSAATQAYNKHFRSLGWTPKRVQVGQVLKTEWTRPQSK